MVVFLSILLQVVALGLALFGLWVIFSKIRWHFRIGVKDHRWFFDEVWRSGLKILLICGFIAMFDYTFGDEPLRALYMLGLAVLGPLVPLTAYVAGRWYGMWKRSRSGYLS